MSFKLRYGDIIHEHGDIQYHVRGSSPFLLAWTRPDGRPEAITCAEGWDPTEYNWCDKIVRRGQVVWPKPSFKVNDRVVHLSVPHGEVGVIIEVDGDTFKVAFNGSDRRGPFIETHPASNLLHA